MTVELNKKLNEMEERAMRLIDEGKLDDAAFVMVTVEQERRAMLETEKRLPGSIQGQSGGQLNKGAMPVSIV